jgi:PAS domain-containing protein
MTAGAQALGLFDGMDRAILVRVAAIFQRPSPHHAPLLIVMDDAIVAQWGAPPWDEARWEELAGTLERQSLSEAFLVDDWQRVVRCQTPPAIQNTGATIRVPMVDYGLHSPQPFPGCATSAGPLAPVAAQLSLGATSDGVVLDLGQRAAQTDPPMSSVFCQWLGFCPEGSPFGTAVALPDQAELPVVSAAALLAGGISVREEGQRRNPVLVGITAAPFAQWVRIGHRPDLVPFPIAVASALASARSAGQAVSLSRLLQTVVILVWFGLAMVLTRLFRAAPVKVFVPTLASAAVAAFSYGLLLFVVPLTGAALAALWPAAATLVSERWHVRDFADRVTRLHRRGGLRFAPTASLIQSEKDLIRKLAWFSRSYLNCLGFVYYRLNNAEQRYEYAGGYHIGPEELTDLQSGTADEPFATAARMRPTGVLCGGVFKDDREARIVPIITGPDIAGMWVVPHRHETTAPAAKKAVEAAQYVASRLSMNDVGGQGVTTGSAFVDELERVHQLVHEAAEERRQLEAVLDELPVPLVIADMSAVVLFVNRALSALLLENDLGVITTMRDLLFRLADEPTATRLANSLFSSRESASFVWSGTGGRSYRIEMQPFYRSWNAPGEELVGFIASFLDITVTFELRNMRKNVSDFLSEQIRARLMRITANLAVAQTVTEEDTVLAYLESVEAEVNGVTDILNKATSFLFEPETKLFEAVPSNPNDMVNMAVAYARKNANGNDVSFDVSLPEVAMPVDIHTAQAIEHLTRILQQVFRTTAAGETVALALREEVDRSVLRIGWPSFQIHADFLEQVNGAGAADAGPDLPPLLVACLQAKEVFPRLCVEKETNTRMRIVIDLRRP